VAEPTSPAASPTASPAPGGTPTEEQVDDAHHWWWLAVAVLLVGGGVAFLLVRRGKSRHAWEARLASAEQELGWFARDLVPQLRGSRSAAEMAGGWAVASPRVVALGDRLSELATTAPGDEQRARAAELRDAVRTAHDRMSGLSAESGPDWVAGLDGVQGPLLAALLPPARHRGEPDQVQE
jgi:hypothetical protein